MVNVWKILRSLTLGNRPSGRSYGEPYVNFAENQFGVVNSSGAAQDLIGVPIFSTTATYAVGQPVQRGGLLYLALVAVAAGAWNASQWSQVASQSFVAGQVPPATIPSGSVMAFWQASAPTGWTQVTTHNDKLLRVVSGTGGGSGGTNAFTSVNAATTVGGHTLALAELPSITSSASITITTYPAGGAGNAVAYSPYGFSIQSGGLYSSGYFPVFAGNNPGFSYTASLYAANNITVTSGSTGGGSHTHPITLGIQYVDLILASKN